MKTFNRSVNRRENTRFYGRLIDEEGKQVESFGNPPGSILDPRQRKTFWRHVGQKNNCVFYWRIVDAGGRRRKSRGNYPGDVL